jgi:hypothetical protein
MFMKNRVHHRKMFIDEHVHQKPFIGEHVHQKPFIGEHVHQKLFIGEHCKYKFYSRLKIMWPAGAEALCRACRLQKTLNDRYNIQYILILWIYAYL